MKLDKRNPSGGVSDSKRMRLSGSSEPAYLEDCRRVAPNTLSSANDLVFMQTDLVSEERQGASKAAGIQLFGITEEGVSVLCRVWGFEHYFYVPAYDMDLAAFRQSLETALRKESRWASGVRPLVTHCEIVEKRSIKYYIPGDPLLKFFKVRLAIPSLVRDASRLVQRGNIRINGASIGEIQTFEATLDYTLRFMIEKEVRGCSWIELPAHKYKIIDAQDKRSLADVEVDVQWDDLIAHKPEGQWLRTAPLRRLSFDIECAGRKGIFPEAEHDPVIQIANYVWEYGAENAISQTVFTLKSCAPIVGANVVSFDKEEDMLSAWSKFVRASDPDLLTGYNIVTFDLKYLLDRAQTLKIADFPYLGRLIGQPTKMRASQMSSTGFGAHASITYSIHGRVVFDMMQLIIRGHKLRSYTLNSVSAEFLGEQKEDVHYSIISDLQKGNEQTRRRLAVYCLKDALLPLRLMNKLLSLTNYMELARVTGIPLRWLVSRGSMIQVVSLLHQKAHATSLLVPDNAGGGESPQFEGGYVFQPKKGYYKDPITIMDFASLYPSIMMAHNICYSTLVKPAHVEKLPEGSFEKSPLGHCFVKRSVKKGILSTMLEELLAARKVAKKDLKLETDPFKKAVLDGRQRALKVSANAVYGFTGANIGKLPCMEISSSVTAYGREMLERTIREVKSRYPSAEVVYGDTDSVMVKFGAEKSLKECMELGEKAAGEISTVFPKPIKLEFEKCYSPYLLISKKRYAGLLYTRPEEHDTMDCKGIESVRRDNCRLVADLINLVLNLLLKKQDIQGAIDMVKNVIRDLLQNKIDISLLVVSKALTKSGDKYDNNQAHVALAEKMRKRDAGTAPNLGDRVPYVIVQGKKGEPAYSRAEDPLFVLEHNLPLDNNYYLENMLRKPLERIFEPVMFSKVSTLFSGDHTRSIKISTPTSGGMMRFAKVRLSCLGCKSPIKQGALCKNCEKNEAKVYLKYLMEMRRHEKDYSALWTECQRCMGDLCNDVLCSNGDCPIFYRRRKSQKDLDVAAEKLTRFGW